MRGTRCRHRGLRRATQPQPYLQNALGHTASSMPLHPTPPTCCRLCPSCASSCPPARRSSVPAASSSSQPPLPSGRAHVASSCRQMSVSPSVRDDSTWSGVWGCMARQVGVGETRGGFKQGTWRGSQPNPGEQLGVMCTVCKERPTSGYAMQLPCQPAVQVLPPPPARRRVLASAPPLGPCPYLSARQRQRGARWMGTRAR